MEELGLAFTTETAPCASGRMNWERPRDANASRGRSIKNGRVPPNVPAGCFCGFCVFCAFCVRPLDKAMMYGWLDKTLNPIWVLAIW